MAKRAKKKLPKALLAKWLKAREKKLTRKRRAIVDGKRLSPGKTRAKVLVRTRKAVRSVVPTAKHGVVRFNPKRSESKKDLILSKELVDKLFAWHGGQGSKTYALASTGLNDYVSLEMIESAETELYGVRHRSKSRADKRDLSGIIGELQAIRMDPEEHSARSYGLEEPKARANPTAVIARANPTKKRKATKRAPARRTSLFDASWLFG